MSKQEERDFHDAFVTGGNLRNLEGRFYSTTAETKETELALAFIGDLQGKRLLFYGSGCHFSLVRKFTQLGAEVIAIDISGETVAQLQQAIERENLQDRAQAIVMDCETLDFEEESIDIVFARSIIHHLDVDTSLQGIQKVLKPGGKLAVLEPLGMNPLINFYRWLTPNSRTSDEHPLIKSDLNRFEYYFPGTIFRYLYFLSILAYFYRMLDKNSRRFERLFSVLNSVDSYFIMSISLYRYLCWDVLICCQKAVPQSTNHR